MPSHCYWGCLQIPRIIIKCPVGKTALRDKRFGGTYLCALGKSQETKKIKGSKKSWVLSLGLTRISTILLTRTTFICSSNFLLMVWLWTPINIFQETKRFFWDALQEMGMADLIQRLIFQKKHKVEGSSEMSPILSNRWVAAPGQGLRHLHLLLFVLACMWVVVFNVLLYEIILLCWAWRNWA